MKSYPSKLLLTALQCLLSSVQSFVIAIAMERHPSQWELGWNVRLLAVAYCVIILLLCLISQLHIKLDKRCSPYLRNHAKRINNSIIELHRHFMTF